MADRYWVGGTEAWDGTAGTKWALTSGGAGGQAVPTAADDVFFDGASGAVTCTISDPRVAKSVNCTGFTGTIAGALIPSLTVSGSVTFVAGMTLTFSGTIAFNGTGTLTSGGKTIGAVTISGSGIIVTLGDALTLTASLFVTQGTFTTNNYNVTAQSIVSNNSNTRTINLGSSTLTLSTTSAVDFTTSTNLTFNAGTSQINLTGASATISGSFQTFYNVSFTSATPFPANFISGENTFQNLTLNASVTGLSSLFLGANQTVNGTFTCSGTSVISRGLVRSAIGIARTLTVGILSATDCDFRDITIAGAAAGTSPIRAGDLGGNSGINFPAPKTVYWNLSGTQDWNATGWALTSGGSPAVNNFPLAQDTAVFDDAGAANTVNFGAIRYSLPAINAANRASAMTLNHSSQDLYGSITLGSGVTITGTGTSFLYGRGTTNITTAGKTITFRLDINVSTGTVRLLDAYNASNVLSLVTGTFDANNYNVTVNAFFSQAAGVRTLIMGSGLWTTTGAGTTWQLSGSNFTFNKGSADIFLANNTTSSRSFNGLGLTYNKLTLGGATAINTTQFGGNNTFSELASTKTVAHTLNFVTGSTTTVGNWTITGTPGNVVTVRTSTAATHNLVKTGGGVIVTDYMSISNSAATPSSTWYAGANSTNGGGNSGWIFGGTSYNSSVSESAAATDSIIGAYPWNLIDNSQNPNWQNINNS